MKVDRRLSLREIIAKVFGYIPYFKSKDELMEDEFDKFDSRYLPDEIVLCRVKYFFIGQMPAVEFVKFIFHQFVFAFKVRDVAEHLFNYFTQ